MASLPKPLSEKSIRKMLDGWKPETVDTLHAYYAAFSNLYGAIMLSDAWKLMKSYEPKITKKEFMDFSSIARRENLPYYILEIDELYSEELRISEVQRFIINKKLVSDGHERFFQIYDLIETQLKGKDTFYRPVKMTDFSEDIESAEWTELREFVGNLKDKDGVKLSEHFGLTYSEKINLDFYKAQSKKDKLLKNGEVPLSDRIVDNIKMKDHTNVTIIFYLSILFDEENIKPTTREYEELNELHQRAFSSTHLWANRGWTAAELAKKGKTRKPVPFNLRMGAEKKFPKR